MSKSDPNAINKWLLCHLLVLYRGRVYVPPTPTLQRDVIRKHHDSPIAGHPGCDKTYELSSRNYWWPAMKDDVRQYVQTC